MIPANKSPEEFAKNIASALGRSPDEPGTRKLAAALAGSPTTDDDRLCVERCRLTDRERSDVTRAVTDVVRHGDDNAWASLMFQVAACARRAYFDGRRDENEYHRARKIAALRERYGINDNADAVNGAAGDPQTGLDCAAMKHTASACRCSSQAEAKPFRDDGDGTTGTLPLTSIGPSGINGYAQTEGGAM